MLGDEGRGRCELCCEDGKTNLHRLFWRGWHGPSLISSPRREGGKGQKNTFTPNEVGEHEEMEV